ncbi:MAG: hydrogenase maturation protease [Vicinamibacterales bacterium]
MTAAGRRTLVLGIGNLLMGDEGVGVHAVAAMRDDPWPAGVTVVDGGTGGFHLLEYFQAYDHVVLIDATMDGQPPGTVRVLRPRYASDYPRTLTAHDIGLKDLVESAALVGARPAVTLVTVSIERIAPMETALSAAVAAAIPGVRAIVQRLVAQETTAHA